MHDPRAGETLGEDFGSPALRQVLRLLGVVFLQEQVVVRLLLVMGKRQMTETFALLARLPGRACQLTHPLKIRNRRIALRQQQPDAPTPFIDGQQVRVVDSRRDPLTHLQSLRIERNGFLVGICLARFVSRLVR